MQKQNSLCTFKVPDERTLRDAIGSLGGVQPRIKKAVLGIQYAFEPIDPPAEFDWLFEHEEYGQPFELYKSAPEKRFFEKDGRNTIYIQPLEEHIGINKSIKEFLTAYFIGCKVKIREPIIIEQVDIIGRRVNEYTNQIQFNAKDITNHLVLQQQTVPKDAICVICLTKFDLYPSDDWNFVDHFTSIMKGISIISFARYIKEGGDMMSLNLVNRPTLLKRALKIVTHEVAHFFGLKNCIYFKCVLNGQNHLDETDKTPLELCVICLRKLQSNIGFAFLDRYQALIEYCGTKSILSEHDLPRYQKLHELVLDAYGTHYAPKDQ